jgi:hypothetical protein
MARGAATSEGSSGENISHFHAVRVRVTGVGNLQMTLYSLDKARSQVLVPLVMAASSDVIPTRLANFTTQRASLELKTTEIDEVMRVNRIVVFSREIFTSYPG